MKEPKELAIEMAEFLYTKKGEDIQVLDVSHLTSIADFFVIASARNTIQCRTMAEDLEDHLIETEQIEARRKDGYRESRWVVLYYGSVIMHLFHEQERAFYNIERLWADGTNLVKQLV